MCWVAVRGFDVSNKAVFNSPTVSVIKLAVAGEHKQYREGYDFICIPLSNVQSHAN